MLRACSRVESLADRHTSPSNGPKTAVRRSAPAGELLPPNQLPKERPVDSRLGSVVRGTACATSPAESPADRFTPPSCDPKATLGRRSPTCRAATPHHPREGVPRRWPIRRDRSRETLGELTAHDTTAPGVATGRDRTKRAFQTWSECTTTPRSDRRGARDPRVPSFDDHVSKRLVGSRRTVLRLVPATKAP